MRISAKGRYALAAMVNMAQQHGQGENITVIRISSALGISKIYLEQVFFLLKRSGLVAAVKGAQGGYRLERAPQQISVLDVLSAVEVSLFEETEQGVGEKASEIEAALRLTVYQPLDQRIRETLQQVTLADLVLEAQNQKDGQAIMFYI